VHTSHTMNSVRENADGKTEGPGRLQVIADGLKNEKAIGDRDESTLRERGAEPKKGITNASEENAFGRVADRGERANLFQYRQKQSAGKAMAQK